MSAPRKSSRSGGKPARRSRRDRHLRIRSELRTTPDIQKIGNAVIALAIAQAEKEAAEQQRQRQESGDA